MSDVPRPPRLSSQGIAPDSRLCWDCNYDLRGLTQPVCPECGRTFDPRDATTVNCGDPVGPIARMFLKPIGWTFALVMAVLFLATLWRATHPAFYYPSTAASIIIVWLIVWSVYGVRATAADEVARRYGLCELPSRRKAKIHLLIATVIVTAILSMKLPLYLGFVTARGELDRIAHDLTAEQPIVIQLPRRAGIYRVVHVEDLSTSDSTFVVLYLEKDAFFIYSPGGRNDWYDEGANGHLAGPWYWFAD